MFKLFLGGNFGPGSGKLKIGVRSDVRTGFLGSIGGPNEFGSGVQGSKIFDKDYNTVKLTSLCLPINFGSDEYKFGSMESDIIKKVLRLVE